MSIGIAARYSRVMEPATLEALRRIFRRMNKGMVQLWRLGLGRLMDVWPAGFGRLMVIEHRGRRSGTRYLTPVNFTEAEGAVFCVAAFGDRTDWLRNLSAAPAAALWLPDGRWEADFEDAAAHPQRLQLLRAVLIDSGFAAPLFGLHPRRMTDAELAEVTASYRLVRFAPRHPAPSADGPGSLAWVWWVLAAVAVARRFRAG